MYSIQQLEDKAKRLGAVYKRTMYNDCSVWISLDRKEPFSVHFFNSNNTEICYYIVSCNLYKQTGLYIFDIPRKWSSELYKHPNCGVLKKLETLCEENLEL